MVKKILLCSKSGSAAQLRGHNGVERLVEVDLVHAPALQGFGFSLDLLERDDGLSDRYELVESGGPDCGIDGRVFLIGEGAQDGELLDVDAIAVKKTWLGA